MKESKSRTKNSVYNVFTALIEYVVKMFITFVIRTIFIKTLGSDFLGLDSLFTSILSVLSVTELGLSSAVVFSLYKPLLERDTKKINILINIYKKSYFIIGGVILFIGLVMMPFLPQIINTDYDFGNIYILFSLYLAQTISTYWILGYKEILLTADQKKHQLTIIVNLMWLLKFVLQTVSLLVFKSFEMFIISSVIISITKNTLTAIKVDKSYPYAKEYSGEKLSKSERSTLIKNLFGVSLYKISSTIMNSTDSIVISTFVSLVTTGIYSNYLLIVSNVKAALDSLFNSVTASIGSLHAEGDGEKSEKIFRCLNFLNFWVYGFVAICFWELLNPLITIWLGEGYIFDNTVVLLIVLNFITDGLQRAVIMYKDACGLFWKGKMRPVFSALLNIVLSVLFVQFMGLSGVILGSIISRLVTTWWFDPYLIYKHAFYTSPRSYYLRYFRSLLIITVSCLAIDGIMHFINLDFYANTIIRLAICVILPNFFFWICSRKSQEYLYLKTIITNWLTKKHHKTGKTPSQPLS